MRLNPNQRAVTYFIILHDSVIAVGGRIEGAVDSDARQVVAQIAPAA